MSTNLNVQPARAINLEDLGPFPQADRIIYDKNPLEMVVCQLRFPPVLRIEADPPVAFQEGLRGEYPLFSESRPFGPELLPPEVASFVGGFLSSNPVRVYTFGSVDNAWQVSLTREWLALTCKEYVRFDQFQQHLKLPLALLVSQYSPGFFTRVGLRYRDVIRRSKLDLDGVDWSALLNEGLVGEFHSGIAQSIERLSHQLVIRLQGDVAHLTINHGLCDIEGESCYIIDSDFFTNVQTETEDAITVLNYFSRQAWRFFRWCINTRLHTAMGPKPI